MEVARNHARAFTLNFEGKVVFTPSFVPAISSCGSVVPIESSLRVLIALNHPRFLVSAHDIENAPNAAAKQHLLKEISAQSAGPTLTVLDSGTYEAQCLRDKSWTLGKLEHVLRLIDVDVCFSFDVYAERGVSPASHLQKTVQAIARTAGAQSRGLTVPVLHASPKAFPTLAKRVVEQMNPQILGMPERELGMGIQERAAVIHTIRRSLDETGRNVPIHLLGTSNPLSILIYTLAGADIFDGLDWSRSAIEPKTGQLQNFAHYELLDCECAACRKTDIPYADRLMAHNLMFYELFVRRSRTAILEDRGFEFLKGYLSASNVRKLEEIAVSK